MTCGNKKHQDVAAGEWKEDENMKRTEGGGGEEGGVMVVPRRWDVGVERRKEA